MGLFAFVIWYWSSPDDGSTQDPSFDIVWPNYNSKDDTGAYTDSAEDCAIHVMSLV